MALKFQINGKKLFVALILSISRLVFDPQNRGYQVNRSRFSFFE